MTENTRFDEDAVDPRDAIAMGAASTPDDRVEEVGSEETVAPLDEALGEERFDDDVLHDEALVEEAEDAGAAVDAGVDDSGPLDDSAPLEENLYADAEEALPGDDDLTLAESGDADDPEPLDGRDGQPGVGSSDDPELLDVEDPLRDPQGLVDEVSYADTPGDEDDLS